MKKIVNNINDFVNKYKTIIIFVLSFPHIFHISFPNGDISLVEFLISRLRLLSFLVIVILYLINSKRPSKLMIVSIAYCVVILLTTLINYRSNMNNAILFSSSFMGLGLLIDYFKDDLIILIKTIMLCLEIQIYPNLYTVIIFGKITNIISGYNLNHFFLGTANDMILYLLPAFFLAVLYIKYIKVSLRPILLILAVITTVMLSDSFATMISLLMFIVFFFYCLIIKKNNIKYPYILLAIPIIILIVVSIPYLFFGKNPLMQFVLDNIYYNHSFECRVCIWSDALKYILEKPFFGHGYYYNNYCMIGNENDIYNLAHNTVIQILLNYGIIGLLTFSLYIFVIIKKIAKLNNSFYKSFFISIVSSIFIVFVSQDYHRFFEFQIVFLIINNFENFALTKNSK